MIRQAIYYILDYYETYIDRAEYCYHSIDHVLSVFDGVTKLGIMERVDDRSFKALQVAALFHDSGIHIDYSGHEAESVQIARVFLSKHHASDSFTNLVTRLIMSTVLDHSPTDTLECIIRDADLSNLGSTTYFANSELLRNEWALLGISLFDSDLSFYKNQLDFIEGHEYHTDSANRLFDRKMSNIVRLNRYIDELG